MLDNIFSIPIYSKEDEVNVTIKNEIDDMLHEMTNEGNYSRCSDGLYLWRFYPKIHNNLFYYYDLENFKKKITDNTKEYLTDLGFKSKFEIDRLWMIGLEPLKNFEVSKKVDYVQMEDYWHSHSHGFFVDVAGVYYHDIDEGNDSIVFMNPNKALQERAFPYSLHNQSQLYKKIYPKNGQILLFPSWLTHRVSQNMSDKDRVALAFDITLQF